MVAAQAETGDRQLTEDNDMTMADLLGIDLRLGIPTVIVTVIRTLPPDLGQDSTLTDIADR